MELEQHRRLASDFRRAHEGEDLLLLPNAWDAGSARLFAGQGFAAVATTSGGMAWSLGYGDGEQVPLAEVLGSVARIVRVAGVPVTVDFESGYGQSPEAVGESVRGLLATGAVGINLEDALPGHGPLRPREEAAARIRAARSVADAAGVPIVINARVDAWMQPQEDPRAPLADAIARAHAYRAAGADCLFPIGLSDTAVLGEFIAAVAAPVNVAAGPAMPPLAQLRALGVRRISTATRLATVAYGAARGALAAVHGSGRFDALASDFTYGDAQDLFAC